MARELSSSLSAGNTEPKDLASEMAFLCAILADNRALAQLDVPLAPGHFADERNAAVFNWATTLIDRGVEANPATLRSCCWADDDLQEDHIESIVQLGLTCDRAVNAIELARYILKLSLRRELIELGRNIVEAAYAGIQDARLTEIVEMAFGELSSIKESHAAVSEAKNFHDASCRIIGQLQHAVAQSFASPELGDEA